VNLTTVGPMLFYSN